MRVEGLLLALQGHLLSPKRSVELPVPEPQDWAVNVTCVSSSSSPAPTSGNCTCLCECGHALVQWPYLGFVWGLIVGGLIVFALVRAPARPSQAHEDHVSPRRKGRGVMVAFPGIGSWIGIVTTKFGMSAS